MKVGQLYQRTSTHDARFDGIAIITSVSREGFGGHIIFCTLFVTGDDAPFDGGRVRKGWCVDESAFSSAGNEGTRYVLLSDVD